MPKGLGSCWAKRTPYQMALILILCVAVPFLIAMVIIYILYGTMWNQSSDCYSLCRNMQKSAAIPGVLPMEGTDATTVTPTTTEFDIYAVTSRKPKSTAPTVKAREMAEKELEWDWEYDEGQILKREVSSLCFEERLRLSSVAALVENLYRDDPTEQAFKCPVVVVARNWVLTTEECVGRDEWKNVSVRINSNYWSKGGFLRRVKRVSRFAKLVALGLERDSATDDCFRPIKTQPKSNSTEGRVLFWDGKITRPLKDRTKYGKLKKTNVKLLSRVRFEGCAGEAGAPLLDPNRNLVGFQVSKSCKEKSTATSRYRDVARRFGWLQMIKNII